MGLHLRGKRHQAAEAGRFHWRIDDVWPRLRDEVKKRKGGLFVAADGHLALLRNALESRAWEDGIAVVTADDLGQGQRGGAMTALAENHILSKCSLIVPTDPSSFLGIAAQRAAAADDSVRAAMACPATSPAVRKSTNELGYCGGLHAIEPTQLRQHRVDVLISTQVSDGVPVLVDGRPMSLFLRDAMPVQLLAAAHPLRLRAGHWTGVEAPLLRGPWVQA